MKRFGMILGGVLLAAASLAAETILHDGVIAGKLAYGRMVDFEQAKAVEVNMKGWGAAVAPERSDWSGEGVLTFSLYSDGKPAELMVTVNRRDGSYYYCKLPVRWRGWKEMALPLRGFGKGKKASGWNEVATVGFSPRGWDIKNNPDAVVYLRSLAVKPLTESSRVVPIPVNIAESIVSPLWDPALSDGAAWRRSPASAELKQSWCGLDFKWRGTLDVSRPIELDCREFDRLIFALSVPPGTAIRLEAADGKRQAGADFRAPDDKMATTEYVLPLNGMSKITSLSVRLVNPAASNGYLKWVALADSARLKELQAYERRMQTMDLSRLVAEPPYGAEIKPGLGIFCDYDRILAIRREMAGNAEATRYLAETREQQLKKPSPGSRWREHVTGDRRWSRDRDYAASRITDCIGAAWPGILLDDRELMRLAARRAIVLAMVPNWGAGIYAALPGTAWEHRAFDESGVVTELIFTLDFCYDFFTPAGRDYILRRVAEKGVGTINFNVWKWNYIFNCNQLSAFSAARIVAYLAMEKSGWAHVRPYTDLAIRELDESMGRIISADGGYTEGPGYYQYTFWGALPAYYCYARARHLTFAEVLPPGLKNAGNFVELSCSTARDQAFIPYNDCGSSGIYPSTASFMNIMLPDCQFVRLYNRYLEKVGAPKIYEYWSWINGATKKSAYEPPYRPFVMVPSMASMASVRKLDGEILKIVMLADAKKDAHKHPDVGQFVIELAGETLAMDAGGVRSYASPFTRVLQSEERHNVMLPVLDDGSFGPQTMIRHGLKLAASGDGETFSAEIDLLPCWETFFTQRMRRMSSGTPDELVIEDRWALKKGRGVAFLWLTTAKIEVAGRRVTIAGERARAEFTVPEGWTIDTATLPREDAAPQHRLMLSCNRRQGVLALRIKFAVVKPAAE